MGTSAKNATVSLDSTATVNLQMQVAAKEAITVTGEAPQVDTASTTTGTNYNAKVIDKLPVGRNYASIVLSQPGVQTDSGETQGRSLAISIYGSTSAENLFLIDGVNTTNVIKGFQGKNINTEFIQEVEVKTGAFQPRRDAVLLVDGRRVERVDHLDLEAVALQVAGIDVAAAAARVAIDLHGDVFGYFDNQSLRANIRNDQTAPYSQSGDVLFSSDLPKNERKEGGVDLGGFALKDHIWFYGAYDRTVTDQQLRPLAGARVNEQFPIKFTSSLYAGKLTFNVAQGTTIVGTLFADPQIQEGALSVPAGFNPFSYNGRRDSGGVDWAGRANQLFGSFGILTLQYSQHKDRFTTTPDVAIVPSMAKGPVPADASVVEPDFGENT